MNIAKTYLVPECNLGALVAALEKLNKRALKLGVTGITWRKTGNVEEVKIRRRDLPNLCFCNSSPEWLDEVVRVNRKFEVEVAGESPRFAGWTLAAVVEHGEEGNIVRKVPGCTVSLAAFRDTKPCCDHCRTLRARNETFVVLHDDGTQKQIGRNCLRDFLGHQDPHALASYAELLFSVSELCEGSEDDDFFGMGSGSVRPRLFIRTFLAYSLCVIRHRGWVSGAKAKDDLTGRTTSTKDMAISWMFPPRNAKLGVDYLRPSDEDSAAAEKVQDFVISKLGGAKELTDFEHTLLVLAKSESVTWANAGIVAYLAQYYARETEQAARAAASPSKHFGTVGQRVRGHKLALRRSTGFDTQFGYCFVYTFADPDGNLFVWKTSTELDLIPGQEIVATFTVKEHSQFRGENQTLISRAKVD